MTGSTVDWADFGPLILVTDIDEAAIATLRTWLNTHLGQIEFERDLPANSLPRPTASSITNVLTDDEFPDHMLPAVLVTTAQTQGAPVVAADGFYTATWRLNVSCVVRGRKPAETRAHAAIYEGAVRRILVSAKGMGLGIGAQAKWAGMPEPIRPVADRSSAGRYLAASQTVFYVYVDQAVQRGVGPNIPDVPPYAPLATVGEITIDVETAST
jgi:hypothetical protein